MFVELILIAGAFAVGTLVGANNYKTVDRAIASLRVAEAKAQVTLGKITDHKAS